ncbi:hypothetical protein BJY00DRAFT_300915 [Aspergillus carlsbadensis]|nr:hypothetical protein BJY00DRAFT_300915 [Aspergillus carlsbadensis]
MSDEMVPLTGGGSTADYNAPFQVTIDAGAATSGMINFSVNALARISHAGIDHFAFGVCVLVGNTVACTTAGLERFYTALSAAPVHAGFQRVLWFGFGHRTPIQILTATESGCRFAALSACLAEVYSVNMAGSIMLEFTRKAIGHRISDPQQQNALPSRLQMTLLVEKCAGIFSASSFPLWAEQYMSFDREAVIGQHAWRHGSNRTRQMRGVASAADIANALHAIMDIRNGSTRHLTFIGVADAALIAAIGAWLLDLKVILYTSERQQDGDIWFRNFADGEDPHLTRDRTIQISDMTALFKSHSDLKPSHDYVVGGRVPWEDALSRTFGDTITVLLSSRKQSFASALGSAARIFSALDEADPDGAEFVHFAGSRFPELADSDLRRDALRSAAAETYQDACAAFEKSLADLASWCRCKPCCQIQPDSKPGPESQDRPVSQRCLVSLTVTIIRLVRGLSGINPTDGLCPTRKGLEYIDRLQQIRVARVAGSLDAKDASLVNIIVEHGIRDLLWTEASPLRFAEYLFRGNQFAGEDNDEPGVSASSRDGICFYLDILRDPLPGDPTALCCVNVIPGHIQFEGRLYYRVGERATDLYNKGALQKRPSDCVPSKVFRILECCAGGDVKLNVTDKTGSDRQPTLEVFFEVLQGAEREATVGPWRVVHNISRGLGVIRCGNYGCEESKKTAGGIANLIQDRPVQTITVGKSKVSLFYDDLVSRLVVTSNCWEPLIQREESLDCCVMAGCKQEWKEFAVLWRAQTSHPRIMIS